MKEPLAVVNFNKDKDASFYWRRFITATQLVMAIDDGAYGNINWWAGSPQTEPDGSVTQLLPVNILPRADIKNINGRPQPGLRFGVQRGAIWGSYRWLVEHGFKEEVTIMMDHFKNPSGVQAHEAKK